MFTFSDRRCPRPHKVRLFKDGEQVGFFTIPETDTRFVKGDDLLRMAFEASQNQPARRYDDEVRPGEWDTLTVFWCWKDYSCDAQGAPLLEMA